MDAIQAAGAVPIDVKAMGIDFLACSAYKWLKGGRFGYLYVREDLQDPVLKAKLFGGRSTPGARATRSAPSVTLAAYVNRKRWHTYTAMASSGSARTCGLSSNACKKKCPRSDTRASHARCQSPIVSFTVKDPAVTKAKLQKAKVVVTLGSTMRVSPSIFNDMSDVERLLAALT